MNSEIKITTELLKSIEQFGHLNVSDLNKISEIAKPVSIKKSKEIFREGEIYKGFYILLKGSVKVSRFSPEGKETIIHLIKPLETFGDIQLFEGGIYPVSSQTTEESVLIFFEREEFLQLLSNNSSICMTLLATFAKRMRDLTLKLEELTSKEITNRLARYLVDEIKRAGTDKLPEPFLKLHAPKKNIAGYLGTITETLSRTFKKLQDEKIIRVSGKSIFVKDFAKLKYYAK